MLVIGLGALVLVALALWKMLIGVDKRVSTSKTAAAAWTYLLAGSLLGLVLAKLAGHPQALDKMMHSGLAGQYGLLIGGTLGSAIAAKGIVHNQVSKKPASKPKANSAGPLQLVQNDAGEADLGDFQYVLFNLVAMIYFLGSLFQTPTDGLPHIPDVLLGLTSVSALGYVTKKALPSVVPSPEASPTDDTSESAPSRSAEDSEEGSSG